MSIKLSKEEVLRLSENPNNMIVSDVLKDRLPSDFYREPVDIGVIRAHVVLDGDDLSFNLSSYEATSTEHTITGAASKEDGLKLMSVTTSGVKGVEIVSGVNTPVKSIQASPQNTKISVDFNDWNGSQECIVTLTLTNTTNNETEKILNG